MKDEPSSPEASICARSFPLDDDEAVWSLLRISRIKRIPSAHSRGLIGGEAIDRYAKNI
jgi:hypothetical protein